MLRKLPNNTIMKLIILTIVVSIPVFLVAGIICFIKLSTKLPNKEQIKILIILSIAAIPILITIGAVGFIKLINKINKFLKLVSMIIAVALLNNPQSFAQEINGLTSFSTGLELPNSAIPVQLTAGVNIEQSEIVVGYVAFFHMEDAKLPKIIFARYGLGIRQDTWELMPLIGIGMLTATTFERIVDTAHNPVYDNLELVRISSQFKILYGLKVQKNIGLGGLFVSVEHCKYNYATLGMFVKIN